MTDTRKPSSVLATGRVVMRAHPELGTAAAELLHTLDTLEDDDRVKARAYLLHVYGVAVGCTPSDRRLEELDTWAQDRNALAAAAGHLEALASLCSEPSCPSCDLTRAHSAALLEVAHYVYGVAVGCTPSDRRLEQLDTWATDRNALAAAAGHMLGMSELLDPEGSLYALNEAHAHALLEVAHRG